MAYDPKPIDTSHVELGDALSSLVERLAENSHDVWARRRMDEGWRFGERRDDERKFHPDLIPYADLPESEKDYDRATSAETLKVILGLGYTILPPGGEPQRPS